MEIQLKMIGVQLGGMQLGDVDFYKKMMLRLSLYKSGYIITMKEIEDAITSRQLSVIDNLGRVPITRMGIIPSKQTCKNYLALAANKKDVSICRSMISKTRTRYTTENSLISAMVLIVSYLQLILIFNLISKES